MAAALVGTFGPRSGEELLRLWAMPQASECDLLELRLDFVDDAPTRVAALIAAAPRPVIATCRRAAEGGGFDGTEAARLDLLRRAVDAGATWVDVEHDVPWPDVERLSRGPARVLRSAHVERLPEDADALVDGLLVAPAAAAKLVTTRGGAADALRLLTLVRDHSGRLAAHASNVPFTRYGAAALGTPFTYVTLRRGGRTVAASIPTVREALGRGQLRRLAPGVELFVLIGGDVEGSVSPDMLNHELADAPRRIVALRWSCDDPAPAIEAIRRFGWAGAAVTIPHKERVLELMRAAGDKISGDVEEVGAVNTVIRRRGGLAAHNTDLAALVELLPDDAAGRTGLVLGAGGAARAAVAALRRRGARPVVYARRPEAAARLAAEVVRSPEEAAAVQPTMMIDATPAGRPGGTPFLDPALVPTVEWVLDMLVASRPTALGTAAAARAIRFVDGLSMLVEQAAVQVSHLRGWQGDRMEMHLVGRAELERRDRSIVLVGLRCSGKSEVAPRLARLLGRPLVDTDAEVERTTGRTPDSMIRAGDEAAFRRAEAGALAAASRLAAAVVSTGGGVALHPHELRHLAAGNVIVLLDAPDDVLLARLAAAPRAPLTDLAPAAEVARQRAERVPIYRELAGLTIDTSKLTPDECAEEIAAAMESGRTN